jgi:predicted nucleic acid-binding protein
VVVFVDTSALICLLDEEQEEHLRATRLWGELMDQRARLLTTDYVRLEAWALLQNRLGLAAVQKFSENYLPVFDLHHVTESQFAVAKTHVLGSGRKALSLVDATSFVVMREEAITHAFAFDRHFREHGFKLL